MFPGQAFCNFLEKILDKNSLNMSESWVLMGFLDKPFGNHSNDYCLSGSVGSGEELLNECLNWGKWIVQINKVAILILVLGLQMASTQFFRLLPHSVTDI